MPTLDEFRRFLLERVDAFNRGEVDAVVDGLPESFEWQFPAEVIDRSAAVRPSELREALTDLLAQFPDLHVEPLEIVEPAPDSFVARLMVNGAGASSGAAIRLELAQVWRFEEGRPTRVREFTDVSEALANARQ